AFNCYLGERAGCGDQNKTCFYSVREFSRERNKRGYFLSKIILGEHITRLKIAGVICIIAGAALVGLGS
ncbi:MAG: hypothetical protein AABY01_00610, partial [Nanoarchaeota archaeon]